jgi:hypothetical protein
MFPEGYFGNLFISPVLWIYDAHGIKHTMGWEASPQLILKLLRSTCLIQANGN